MAKTTPQYGCYQKTGLASHAQPISRHNAHAWGKETPMLNREYRAQITAKNAKSSVTVRVISGCKFNKKKYQKT